MAIHLKSVTFQPEKYPTRACYPFTLPILQHAQRLAFDAPVTLFVGENGAGKSTVLEAITQASGIHIWRAPDGRRYAPNPHEGTLGDYLALEWTGARPPGSFFGADTFRHFTHMLDECAATDPGQLKYFGGQSLVTQSHGQSLMAFFRSRYQAPGLYLLDEPEAALSPRSQLELLEVLGQASASGWAQFIISTHSPILLACPNASLYNFDQAPLAPVTYEQTAHFQIYRDFLASR